MFKLAGPDHPFVDPVLLKAKHDEASAAADKHYQETDRLEAPRIEKEMLTAMAAEIDEMYVCRYASLAAHTVHATNARRNAEHKFTVGHTRSHTILL